jgi:hypothetical protein
MLGLDRVGFGIFGFLTIVSLTDFDDVSDGEESSVWTNRTSINSRSIGISHDAIVENIARPATWRPARDPQLSRVIAGALVNK